VESSIRLTQVNGRIAVSASKQQQFFRLEELLLFAAIALPKARTELLNYSMKQQLTAANTTYKCGKSARISSN
jgi:hypothetical protein